MTHEPIPTSHTLSYRIDGRPRSVTIDGATEWGPDVILLDEGDDLIARTSWHEDGFAVAPFLTPDVTQALREGMTELVRSLMSEAGVRTDGAFMLEHYHHYVVTDEQHQSVVSKFRKCLPISRFPVDPELLCECIGDLCGERLKVGSLGGTPLFCIRIIRPGSNDQNPLHRDGWLEHLRACLNIYAPLGGSTALSSLGVVPRSHLWFETDVCRTTSGSIVDGTSFTVPTVAASKRRLDVIRPNPGPEEVLVFSPFLIHGGAPNLETDLTRVSLELRFVRADD